MKVGKFRLRFRTVARSLLIGLAMLMLVLAPHLVYAIAPISLFHSQQAKQIVEPLPITEVEARLPVPTMVSEATTSPQFVPRQEVIQVDSSNYDQRMATDIHGNPVDNDFIAVLHETVGSAGSAINTFRRSHANDNDQVSYHALVQRNGTISYLVPPEMRAFGAGNSVFAGANGNETVRLDAVLPPSVNNFAYHASLESPSDGRGNSRTHSGYTDAQYQSLAWLIAQTDIPEERITTHQSVDRSGSRRDPRSFDFDRFFTSLRTFRQAQIAPSPSASPVSPATPYPLPAIPDPVIIDP
jgi:N-acetyl-anhydromuramyl-L-alanine amidase AmpD